MLRPEIIDGRSSAESGRLEPAQALAGISRKAVLRELAIVDDIAVWGDLQLDDLGDRAVDPRGDSLLIVGVFVILGDEHLK
jgi:hypothetical protein